MVKIVILWAVAAACSHVYQWSPKWDVRILGGACDVPWGLWE
jgi:hypothetical protein